MNLNQLRNFKKLAELENYSRAAKELYISQPSLTNEVKKLEKELGYQLFQRIGRGVKLTKYGQELYAVVSETLNVLDFGLNRINQKFENDMDIMEIACIPTAVGTYLPKELATYKNQFSDKVNFKIYSKHTQNIVSGVKNGLYDLGISSKLDTYDSLTYIPLYKEPFIVILPEQHPLAKRQQLNVSDLISYTIHTYTPTIPIGKELIEAISPTEYNQLTLQIDATDEITIAGEVSVTKDPGIVADTIFLNSFNLVKIPLVVLNQNTRKVYGSFLSSNPKINKIRKIINFLKQN
ncbi:LysR family transcriptional regulator [Limosilactobacillus fermentum]